MGKSDKPLFCQTFPEVNSELHKWAKAKVAGNNCDSVSNYLRDKIILKVHKTYLDVCGYSNNQLLMDDFLKNFELK